MEILGSSSYSMFVVMEFSVLYINREFIMELVRSLVRPVVTIGLVIASIVFAIKGIESPELHTLTATAVGYWFAGRATTKGSK